MAGFPYIFTFYSYKGGVGRSMAVLNTAYTLAGWGKHVLIVDMDLEAPGVTGFLDRQNELAPVDTAHPLDVLTLLQEVVSAVRSGTPSSKIAAELPPLDQYLRSVAPEQLKLLAPKIGTVGRLDVLAADMKRDWCARLANLRLEDLQRDRLSEVSRALHFYFKNHRFPHRPLGVVDSAPLEPTPYDYILIDSRTGITEIGGMCVGPLADRLVVLSSLNDQNIEGTRTFLLEAGITPAARTPETAAWDEGDNPAESEIPTLGPKPTMLVASPVPNGEIRFKGERLDELEKKIGIRPSRLSYHPQMALLETIFVRDYEDEYLAGEYTALAASMTRQAGDHPAQLMARVSRRQGDKKDPFLSIPLVLRLASQEPGLAQSLLTSLADFLEPETVTEREMVSRLFGTLAGMPEFREMALNNWGNALSAQAKTRQGEEADRLFAEAGTKFAEALKIKPDDSDPLYNWGNALLAQAKTKQGEEAGRLFAEAGAKYAEALKIKPDKHEALNNWGLALSDQAKTKQGEEADRLFAEAGAKYVEALKIKPDKHEALNNWGTALLAQAKTKQGEEADRLFAEAGAKYAEALKIKPDDSDPLYNWGNALFAQAETKQGEGADRLFAEAGAKYAEALKIKPNKHGAINNWGNALLAQARTKQGEEADRLFAEAGAKYAEALKIKPDDSDTLTNWGTALSAQAKTKQGEEADRLFAEAGAKFAEALKIKPDKHEALTNWGTALSDQAKTKQGGDAAHLFSQSREKLIAGEALNRGSAAFNLACLESLLGNASESLRWLEIAISAGERISARTIGEDRDFDLIRNAPEFAAFVEKLPPE